MQTEPWKNKRHGTAGPDFPATYVSWNDAIEFCRRLTAAERKSGRLSAGWEYTLPTEAQWERACRARTGTRYSFGDDEKKLSDFGWFKGNTAELNTVGTKLPNPWGLYDMHGNVWEWCRDLYVADLPGGRDPEITKGEDTARVFRGGGWSFTAEECRSALRIAGAETYADFFLGFRVALASSRNK